MRSLKIVFITFSILSYLVLTAVSFAGRTGDGSTSSATGTPTVYEVNPISFQLCNSYDLSTGACSGDTFTFVKTYTANNGFCDLAGVSPGQDACVFGSTEGMTVGHTYNYVRTTVKRDMNITGTVTITGSDWDGNSSIDYCSTNSANTNSNDIIAAGTPGQTASKQTITMITAPGNETDYGNATVGTANTTPCGGASCSDPAYFKGFEGTALAKGGGSQYSYTWSYTTPQNSIIWMGDIETNASDAITLIYALTESYTVQAGRYPTIKMVIDVTDSLFCGTVDGTNDGSSDATEICYCETGSPSISWTILD